jgi:hypothetical protein
MGRERRRVRLRSVVEWWRCACLVGLGMMEVMGDGTNGVLK